MNRRLHTFILSGMICLSFTSSLAFAESNSYKEQENSIFLESVQTRTSVTKITTANVNLRSGASTTNKIILTIPKGESVNVLSISGTWSKVTYKNNTGYVSSEYLKSVESTTKKYEVITDTLNIRSSASTSSTILGKLSQGTKIDVISVSNGWAKFKYNNRDAYVSTLYLKLVSTSTSGSTTTTPNTSTTKKYEITEALNVRASQSWSSTIMGTLNKGTKVDVISISNGWAKIKYNNKDGYVTSSYLKLVDQSTSGSVTTAPNTSTTKKYEVICDLLNIRSSASTSSTILGKLSQGTKIDIISVSNGWAKFKYNNRDAYVSTSYLKLIENEFCTVTQDVYLRKEKAWSAEKLKLIEKGEKVEYLNKEDAWAKVKSDNEEGYISSDYISTPSNNENEPSNPNLNITKYTTTTVNFRKGPSTSYEKIGSIPEGSSVTVIETQNDWDKISYNGKVGYVNNKYLTITKPSTGTGISPSPEFGKTKIVIDAGHGGADSGAVGKYLKLKEKDLVLDITLRVNKELSRLGFSTILTRSTDVYPSLSSRYRLANDNNADLFLSVHFNSASNEKAKGIETLYRNSSGFAKSLQDALIEETNAVDRGLKYRSDLAVLNGSKMTASLVELGFISNKEEESLISTDEYKQKLANAIVKGIVNYVK